MLCSELVFQKRTQKCQVPLLLEFIIIESYPMIVQGSQLCPDNSDRCQPPHQVCLPSWRCQQFHFIPALLHVLEKVLGSNPDSQAARDANDIWTGIHVWFPEEPSHLHSKFWVALVCFIPVKTYIWMGENIYSDTSSDLAKFRSFSSLMICNFTLPCLALPCG